jgi:hypothetical protein
MMSNPRLNIVPAYLIQAAQELADSERRQRIAHLDEEQRKMFRSGRVSMRWAKSNMDLTNHGFGVHEDKRTGSTWKVEGEELVRLDSDEDIEAIIASLTA